MWPSQPVLIQRLVLTPAVNRRSLGEVRERRTSICACLRQSGAPLPPTVYQLPEVPIGPHLFAAATAAAARSHGQVVVHLAKFIFPNAIRKDEVNGQRQNVRGNPAEISLEENRGHPRWPIGYRGQRRQSALFERRTLNVVRDSVRSSLERNRRFSA